MAEGTCPPFPFPFSTKKNVSKKSIKRYFVDLVRATPLDANYLGKEGAEEAEDDMYARNEAVLRPELIAMFAEAKDLRPFGSEEAKEKPEGETTKSAEEDAKDKKGEETPVVEGAKDESKGEQADKENKETKKQEKEKEAKGHANFAINANALSNSKNFRLGGDAEQAQKDNDLVKDMAVFLKEALIPRLVSVTFRFRFQLFCGMFFLIFSIFRQKNFWDMCRFL